MGQVGVRARGRVWLVFPASQAQVRMNQHSPPVLAQTGGDCVTGAGCSCARCLFFLSANKPRGQQTTIENKSKLDRERSAYIRTAQTQQAFCCFLIISHFSDKAELSEPVADEPETNPPTAKASFCFACPPANIVFMLTYSSQS